MRLFKPSVRNMLAKRDVDGLIRTLADPDLKLRDAARDALTQIGEPALAALCVAIHDEQDAVRINAAWALGDIGEKASSNARVQAEEVLLAALQDGDGVVRQNAAYGLGQIGDLRAIPALTEALKDQAMPVRRNAASALGRLGDKDAGGLAVSLNDTDPEARTAAYQAFFGLLALMSDGEKKVREAARTALAGFGQAAIIPLTNTLANEKEEIAGGAARILSEKGEAALPALSPALQHGNPRVRGLAIQAIGEIGVKAKKDSDPYASIMDMLTGALKDSEARVRQQAARSLGALGDNRALPALTALDNDTDAGVREVVLDAKKALGWRPPPPPLAILAQEFKDVADEKGMDYVVSKHSRGELTDPAELRRASIGSAINAMRERYGLSDAEIQVVLTAVVRGLPGDQKILDTLKQLCAAYAANDTAAIARLEPEAKDIGEALDQRGGLQEMRRVFGLLGDRPGIRTLEMHWNGIGEWRG